MRVPSDTIEIDKIQSALSAETKSFDLLKDLDKANQYGNKATKKLFIRKFLSFSGSF
ncbi:MAG: hypothetical protein ACJ72S_08860 [Nitrososphaeraceae archaeon]